MKEDNGLYAYRRHLTRCPFFGPGGRDARVDKCKCPFHLDGLHNGRRVRGSLKTGSHQIALRRLAEKIRELDAKIKDQQSEALSGEPAARERTAMQRTVSEATDHFLSTKGVIAPDGSYRGDVERATFRKYKNSLRCLSSYCKDHAISQLSQVEIEALEDFRRGRKISSVTWKVERQTLITFFGYCLRRGWITRNPARELTAPRNLKPNEVVPYKLEEESKILAACDRIGRGKYNRTGASYEQLRARAMIMLLRHTALRVSDVVTLRKDSISWDKDAKSWRVYLHTQKTGDPVFLPIPEVLKLVLDSLPVPRNAAQDCAYYFWNAQTSKRAVVGIAERTLHAVFKKSEVKNAHAHRFRHTLATRLLEQGATFDHVADILGNSPDVVRKHYGKWSKVRQGNIDRLMLAHFATMPTTFPVTPQSHEKKEALN